MKTSRNESATENSTEQNQKDRNQKSLSPSMRQLILSFHVDSDQAWNASAYITRRSIPAAN